MPFEIFDLHLLGQPQEQLIDWLGTQYFVIYLFYMSAKFIDSGFYLDDGYPIPKMLAKHITFKGKKVTGDDISKLKYREEPNKPKTIKRINLIINELDNL